MFASTGKIVDEQMFGSLKKNADYGDWNLVW